MTRYIDADELEIEYYDLSIHGTMAVKSVLPIFTDLLEKQPTADVVEVKHGEWFVTDSFDHHKTPIYQCSICRKTVAESYINLHKYCLHCGALMDGGKKE